MSAPPDQSNLKYGWLAKAKLEEERARLQKFEEDKAKKEKKPHSPWPPEAWHAARENAMLGVAEKEKRYPIIVTGDKPTGSFTTPSEGSFTTSPPGSFDTSSTGPLTTPEKLQEVADLPSVPELKWTTMTSIVEEEAKELEKKELPYCDVNWEQLERVYGYSEGEDVIVWFQGKKRFAWLAHSVGPSETEEGNAD